MVPAKRPLQVTDREAELAFDFSGEGMPKLNPSWQWEDEEEAVMLTCSSLVTIVKDKDSNLQVVQFSHFSVKKFLTADWLVEPMRDFSPYHIPSEVSHTLLTQ